MSCKHCIHWTTDNDNVKHTLELRVQDCGTCIRFPPTPVLINQGGNIGFTSVYPIVPAAFPPCSEFLLNDKYDDIGALVI